MARHYDFTRLEKALSKPGVFSVCGLDDTQRLHVLAGLARKTGRMLLLVTATDQLAQNAADDLSTFLDGKVSIFPAREVAFHRVAAASSDLAVRRIEALGAAASGALRAMVAPVDALLYPLMPPSSFRQNVIFLKEGMVIAVGTSIVLTGILLLTNSFLFGFFTTTPALIELATGMMNIMAVGYACVAITQVCGGVMRGAGDTVTPMWISIFTTIVLRLPIAYIMAYFTRSAEWPNGHPYSLSASIVTAWVLGGVISVIAYRMGKWRKNIAVLAGQDQP